MPCLSAALAGQICGPAQHSRQIEPAALSSREKQILGLVVMGYMNSQIAEQLFLAESTVKSHLSSAFAKLDVRSRHDAVEFILDAERGLGLGILALGGDPLPAATSTASRIERSLGVATLLVASTGGHLKELHYLHRRLSHVAATISLGDFRYSPESIVTRSRVS